MSALGPGTATCSSSSRRVSLATQQHHSWRFVTTVRLTIRKRLKRLRSPLALSRFLTPDGSCRVIVVIS